MAKSDEGDLAPSTHRPLPSVDLALLPHERRASRVRQLLSVGLGVLLTLVAVGLFVFRSLWLPAFASDEDSMLGDDPWPSEMATQGGPGQGSHAKTATVVAAAEPSPPPTQPATAAREDEGDQEEASDEAIAAAVSPMGGEGRSAHLFGQARGFRDALRNAGASPEEADALVAALDKVVDFRRCRPEHELFFERDAEGRLQSFEYKSSLTDRFVAERKSDGSFKGARAEVPIQRQRVVRGGRISDSLGRAIEALGLGRSLASAFVAAFEGRVDFKKDTRSGDEFRLVVEEEYVEGKFLRYSPPLALHYQGERVKPQWAFWFELAGGEGDFYAEDGRAMQGGWLRTPLRYDHISSRYDLRRRHPILKRIVPHNGIDYAASSGTPIWAAADGVVSFAGERGANGNLVALRHAGGYETFYAHLLRINRGIRKGAEVKQRQAIGAVGTTGRSTGPHLHFALKRGGRFIDPESQLNGPGKPLPGAQMQRFKQQVRALKRELSKITLAAAPAPEASASTAESEATSYVEDEPLDL
ncbi:MAG: M23 family metallopeptidase [Myxococcales bacterium]|nr:M23 family metallopeptidase [Myxococcales bacterium]